MYWNILRISLLKHLNGRNKNMKMAPQCVLTKQEDEVIAIWVHNLQNVGLSIILQQVKLKVVEVT
jgi:hypothetical protein